MSPARSIALASTLAVDSESEPASASSDTSTALAAPIAERGAQARDLAVGRHRDEDDLAAAGLVGELERHLDAVGVGVVEDELARPLERVVGVELPGTAGSGICFTQTAMFIGAPSCVVSGRAPTQPVTPA